jgi:hypothetical protein
LVVTETSHNKSLAGVGAAQSTYVPGGLVVEARCLEPLENWAAPAESRFLFTRVNSENFTTPCTQIESAAVFREYRCIENAGRRLTSIFGKRYRRNALASRRTARAKVTVVQIIVSNDEKPVVCCPIVVSVGARHMVEVRGPNPD